MGLFATLAASAGTGSGGGSSSADDDKSPSSSASALPTAIQLHTTRRIDFLTGTIDGRGGISASTKRRFEVLSYQAVEVADTRAGGAAGGEGTAEQVRLLGSSQRDIKNKKKHLRPNLGIWDCRLTEEKDDGDSKNNSKELADRLLGKLISPSAEAAEGVALPPPPTVLFAVDLSDPARIYPAIDAMISALIRRYGNNDGSQTVKTSAAATGTTRLSKLRTTKFGAALESTDATLPADATKGPDGRISLIICCAVPTPPAVEGGDSKQAPPQTFQEKQAVSLVQYHLHRFASEVDCTLAFVRADDDGSSAAFPLPDGGAEQTNRSSSSTGKAAIPSMAVSEFAGVVSRVAAGMSPVEEEEVKSADDAAASTTNEGQETKEDSGEGDDDPAAAAMDQPPVYAPGTHDDDLISSVLLRNASCPGVWDAAKDDLWKALPPTSGTDGGDPSARDSKAKGVKDAKVGGAAADEAWLSRLAASLPAYGATSAGDDASVKTSKSKSSSAAGGSFLAKASGKKKKPSSSKASTEKKNDDPTSFFENLMKK